MQRYVFSVNDLTIAVEQSRNLTWNDLTAIASAIFLLLWLVILVASFGFPLSCALEIKISLTIFDINRILRGIIRRGIFITRRFIHLRRFSLLGRLQLIRLPARLGAVLTDESVEDEFSHIIRLNTGFIPR